MDTDNDLHSLSQKVNHNNGRLWNNLSESEKEDLLLAYDESFDKNNLLSHEKVKSEHEKFYQP